MNIKGLKMPARRPSPSSARPPPSGLVLPPLVKFEREVPPVRRVLMAMARRLLQICTTATAEALAGEDLTPLQYAVIAYVHGEPDLDQSGLAARLGIDRNNASLLVEQLEAKRLLSRRVNGADRRARLLRLTPLAVTVFTAVPCFAQPWPQRTVRVVMPNPPGVALDVIARLFAARLAARWGQPVIVENLPGADGIIAVREFVEKRNNHTLLYSFAGLITIN